MSSQSSLLSFVQTAKKTKVESKATEQTTMPCIRSLMGEDWKNLFRKISEKPYYSNLTDFLTRERKCYKIYPENSEVYSFAKYFPIRETKVVIIGQDPYHGPNQAHGLCFSVKKGVRPPPSLINIYTELKSDIIGFDPPKHGFLEGWAKQGVLLLNSVLTVRDGQANSHQNSQWNLVTDEIIDYIDKECKNVVFILWGNFAQKKCAKVNRGKHLIIKSVHPSPLSAMRGFFGSKPFSTANEYLKKNKRGPINWTSICHED
ncbi:MAG: hypothetical protein MHPSP_002665 [Paramarteilia canceri]